MRILRFFPGRAALALLLLAAAGSGVAQEAVQIDPVSDIAAQIEAIRDLLREEGKWAEALNRLNPLLARLLSVPEAGKRIELSAEVFLLRGIASVGLGDEPAAFREFQSLYALGPEIARAAAKNVFDPKILPLLKRAERESLGQESGYFLAVVSDPVGAAVSVNGREIGETPVLFQATGPGTVLVEVKLAGFQPVREEAELKPGGTRREYALVPMDFSLRVRSIPTGARVLLDGEDTGKTTEAEIEGLSPGPHKIRLELPAYRPWEGVIEATKENPRVELERRLISSSYFSEEIWGGLESTLFKSPTILIPGLDGGYIVADASEGWIKVLDGEGRLVGGPDPGTMSEHGLAGINGLAVDRKGRFLVSDPENHVVFLLQPDGRLAARWGSFGSGPGELNTPAGLAVDDDESVYIADTGNDRLQIRSADGIPLATWGGQAGGPVSFQSPRAVAIRGNRIYVLDSRRIQIFDKDGTLQAAWEPKGPEGESLSGLSALTVDDDDCVFLADPGGNRVLKFDPAGEFVCAWGAPGIEAGELGVPCGLCLDGRGRICVVERENHRIQIFRVGMKQPDGGAVAKVRPSGSRGPGAPR